MNAALKRPTFTRLSPIPPLRIEAVAAQHDTESTVIVDNYLIDHGRRLVVLADGLRIQDGLAPASTLATRSVWSLLREDEVLISEAVRGADLRHSLMTILQIAVRRARDVVKRMARFRGEALEGPANITAMLITDRHALIAQSGSGAVLLVRQGQVRCLSAQDVASTGPAGSQPEIELISFTLEPGDALGIHSAGLNRSIDISTIQGLVDELGPEDGAALAAMVVGEAAEREPEREATAVWVRLSPGIPDAMPVAANDEVEMGSPPPVF